VSEPPVTGTWHDQAAEIAEAARGALRLASNDPDLPRLPLCARSACAMIDHRLQLREALDRMPLTVGGLTWWTYAVEDVPADVYAAAVQLCGEQFRRKDAPFGVLNAASANAVPMYVSRDQLAGVESLLAPYVEGWGFA
jgi:hypothetical protein